jgi:hypothetical protein
MGHRGHQESEMGTIIEFPAARRLGSSGEAAPRAQTGTIVILPVVRIEREADGTNGGRDPEQGAAAGRRRPRR